MPVVVVPHSEPVKLARYEFAMLLTKVLDRVEAVDERQEIELALGHDGLLLDRCGQDLADRLARHVAMAADDLRFDIMGRGARDDRELGFAETLAHIEMLMHDLFEHGVEQ